MSEGLSKRTIAEFVGDELTIDFLKAHGVDSAQGYYLRRSRAVSAALQP